MRWKLKNIRKERELQKKDEVSICEMEGSGGKIERKERSKTENKSKKRKWLRK